MTVALATLIATAGRAQTLASRISATSAEKVTFTFEGRPGVCGNGESFNISGVHRSYRGDDGSCVEGPIRVTLTRATGAARARSPWSRMKVTVASRAPAEAVDLGEVPPAEASDWLLRLAESGDARVGNEAVMPAVVARDVETWPRLVVMAKRQQLPSEIRQQAIFWLGQAAADEATKTLEETIDDPEREIRQAALFAISQQDTDHSIDVLVKVARTHPDRETRRNAFFWLGQTEDPRGIALFEEVLAGR
jgi:hypothetical protein